MNFWVTPVVTAIAAVVMVMAIAAAETVTVTAMVTAADDPLVVDPEQEAHCSPLEADPSAAQVAEAPVVPAALAVLLVQAALRFPATPVAKIYPMLVATSRSFKNARAILMTIVANIVGTSAA